LRLSGTLQGRLTIVARNTAGVLCPLLVVALVDSVSASPLHNFVGALDSRSPLTQTIDGCGPATAFHNPALLGKCSGFSFGVGYLHTDLDIDLLERPMGADITEDIYLARVETSSGDLQTLPSRPLPTAKLRNSRGATVNPPHRFFLMLGHAGRLGDRVAWGIHAALPLGRGQQQQSFYVDEREQFFSNALQFEMYGDRLVRMAVAGGMGIDILDSLAVGVGVTLATHTRVLNEIYMPDVADQESFYIASQTSIDLQLLPHGGVSWEPADGTRFALTVHAPSANRIAARNELQFWDYPYPEGQDTLVQKLVYEDGYEPLRLKPGVRQIFDLFDVPMTVSLTGGWQRWSAFVNRQGETPLDPWADTFDLALGGQASFADHRIDVGAALVPSPVPSQDGRQNYVDNHRVGIAAGLEWDTSPWGLPLAIGLQLQLHFLVGRSHEKRETALNPVVDEFPASVSASTGASLPAAAGLQSNNPGYPGFSSGGWFLSSALFVRGRE